MPRALFQKTGNAVWMSHLDLMRLFQRAFKRAELSLTHTQGFNPRPSVSIALPLSVGVKSCCELLDFDLHGQTVPCNEIKDRLNAALVEGVEVLAVYDECRKIGQIAYLDCEVAMEYDGGIPEGAEGALRDFFAREEILVEKKSKNGITVQNIVPMIRSLAVRREDDHVLTLVARVCCQNPTLNPAQLSTAVGKYLPELAPDFSKCSRLEIYDTNEKVFR